ncbi:MAG: bifunctional adenosylcobinamide kinase/adenosylcobinamide-phosphate guanylyltransferase [Dehalococcoidia bacterium]
MSSSIVLVTGGVRSGKSHFAAELAAQLADGGPVRFIATAHPAPNDYRMLERIRRHLLERPDNWTTAEAPVNLAEAVREQCPERVVLVDCLTVWQSNLLEECGNPDAPGFSAAAHSHADRHREGLLSALHDQPLPVVLVASEVGLGVAPATTLGNVFADVHGETNRKVADIAAEVYMLVAGIPVKIK